MLILHFSGRLFLTVSLRRQKMLMYISLFSFTLSDELIMDSVLAVKKFQHSTPFTLMDTKIILPRGVDDDFHAENCRFFVNRARSTVFHTL
jgi:hypothetical protein